MLNNSVNPDQYAGGIREIWNTRDALQLLAGIKESESVVAIDTETEGVDPSEESPVGKGRIVCWSIAYYPKVSLGTHSIWKTELSQRAFIPNWGSYESSILQGVFRKWLESDWPKVGHNFTTFDAHIFENHGIRVGGVIGDTLRISRLCNSTKETPHDLKSQGYIKFGYGVGSYQELFSRPGRLAPKTHEVEKQGRPKGIPTLTVVGTVDRVSWSEARRELIPLSTVPEQYPQRLQTLIDYASLDAKITLELWSWFKSRDLIGQKTKFGTLDDLNNQVWHPMLLVLNRCERNGFRINKELAEEKATLARANLLEYETILNEWADFPINWKSGTHQVAPFLYDKLELPVPPICGTLKAIDKTKEGKRPTSEAAIYWLELWANRNREKEHAIGLANLRLWKKTTRYLWYLETLPKIVDSRGYLHTVLAPEADTGRLSAKYPPLQQIPGKDPYKIREIFIPSPGHKLVVADYSQLEVYVLAHIIQVLSQGKDTKLTEALQGDVYGEVAKTCWPEKLAHLSATEIKGCGDKELTQLRDHAKITVLSTNYLKSAEGLALSFLDETGDAKPVEYGEALQASYFSTFPGVPRFQQWIADYARKYGCVPTLFGRRRPIPQSSSPKHWIAAEGGRIAANTPMQGGAADIVGKAMVLLNPYTGCGIPVNPRMYENSAVLNLQVHDELVFETPEGTVDAVASEVKRCMEADEYGLQLGLKAEVKICDNWSEGK
jgi:DNA polymerase-1